ncbi:MAG: ATP-binding cassette domain-containing protein [Candidatus Heimdallarchaeaceae archaeon]
MKLQIKDLAKIYDHPYIKGIKTPVLMGINDTFNSREVTTIYGPSGSGKSTFIKILRGLETISAGEIYLNDKLLIDRNGALKKEFAEQVGYIDQFPERNLYFSLTPFENIIYKLKTKQKIEDKQAKELVFELFKEFNIDEIAQSKMNTLSSGELQRLALVAAIANKPKILLCDEPTAKLDRKIKNIICNFITNYSRLNDVITIVVTHNEELNFGKKKKRLEEGRFYDLNS